HPIIRKITFTGSTIVGKQLAALAGLHMKRATMELGGHAPVIICNDADIANAAKVLSGAKLRNAGQVCISPTRFLVQEGIAQEFIRTFTNHMESTTVGQGLEEGVQMGPLANIRRLEAMKILTKDAIDHGAELMTGGEQIASEGNFFSPTVLNNVSLTAKIFNEEPFGPIAGIKTFSSLDSAIEEANRLPFGLASYAFTSSLKNTHELVNKLSVGMLWVNQPAIASPEMPFGGVKDSGYGSEGGPEALEAYLISKAVSILNV
ncbi:MAG: aldehyde dehydrogenase family protein, partial [Burkholderiaceae bacterium]|nr:aldehyde dehydrogenase family protein [Burkholderiaceae bacterium]